jgi:hypothetical protein
LYGRNSIERFTGSIIRKPSGDRNSVGAVSGFSFGDGEFMTLICYFATCVCLRGIVNGHFEAAIAHYATLVADFETFNCYCGIVNVNF